jgi:hypothetical protein
MTPANLTMRAILLTAILWAGGGALVAKADPLPDPPPQVLPDPSPRESHNFPPALATAGTADPGRELTAVKATNLHDQSCTALNPCAAPPPSLQRAETMPSRAPTAFHPG